MVIFTINIYYTIYTFLFLKNVKITLFDLITAHAHISAQSSNSVVFRLQPVYFLSASL